MYNVKKGNTTDLYINTSTNGISIEKQVAKALTTGEKLDGNEKIIYTERKLGAQPAYDYRTDRWDIALGAIEKTQKSQDARRQAKMEIVKDENPVGEPKSAEGNNK